MRRTDCFGHRGGTTLVDLLFGMVAIAMMLGVFGVAAQAARDEARKTQDGVQLRGVLQSKILWGFQHGERFPLPSLVDRTGDTVNVGQDADGAPAQDLDSTRNIYSLLMYHGFIHSNGEIFVSPLEVGHIKPYEGYQVENPEAAQDPERAAWDPAFRATPADRPMRDQKEGDAGGFSYAHAPAFGERRAEHWRDTNEPDHAVTGNRGPQYDAEGRGAEISWGLVDGEEASEDYDRRVGTKSNRLRIYGPGDRWAGWIVYNDARAEFHETPEPETLRFTFSGLDREHREQWDNVFVNEDDRMRDSSPSREREVVREGRSEKNTFLISYRDRIRVRGEEDELSITIRPFYD